MTFVYFQFIGLALVVLIGWFVYKRKFNWAGIAAGIFVVYLLVGSPVRLEVPSQSYEESVSARQRHKEIPPKVEVDSYDFEESLKSRDEENKERMSEIYENVVPDPESNPTDGVRVRSGTTGSQG